MTTHRIPWSDNDRYFGPLTISRNSRSYNPLALVLVSGDDEYRQCKLRLSAFNHTIILALPPIIRPWRQKVAAASWDAATIKRLGRNWYWDTYSREYGFSYSDGFLQIYLGRQTNDSGTTQQWSTFLPWTQWRHVRHSMYDLEGKHFWTRDQSGCRLRDGGYEATKTAGDACPSRAFAFIDFDGQRLTAITRIEEREWHFGTGWFKWLSIFTRPKISRSLDIRFSGETGRRKGSWKGGTLGHGIEMLPGELHEVAFKRYCAEHEMTFVGGI